jgi:UDP-glucose:(heptosyl)LPS alpha-1,3-glucosyltransferase
VYCAADAFVLPSQYEGFALVTVEAAAAGLPLLVTNATGASELARRAGGTPIARDVDAYTSELRRLGDDPDMRRERGMEARRAVQELSWPRIVAAYAGVCELAN